MFVTTRSEETIYGEGGIDASLVEDLLLKRKRDSERMRDLMDIISFVLCRYVLLRYILMCVFHMIYISSH